METYDGAVRFKIEIDGKSYEGELETAKEKTEGLGEEIGKLTAADALMAAGAAKLGQELLGAASAAVQLSTNFDAAFAKTQTIMDTAAVSAENMRQDILELSSDSAMAASDVSEAVYQAISGSVATADAAGFVSDANKLAVAGFTSLSNATDVLTTTLNAYKLEASAVAGISNVLLQTQNLGKTSVNELSASIGRAISTGSAYGVNLQNLATSYVELTRGGIATAEATTYLSSMLNELGDAGSKVGKTIQEKTGKSFGQLMQDGESLGNVLDILSTSVDGNSEAFMGLWGSQEAGKAANALVKASVEDFNLVLADMNDQMAGVTSTTDDAYKTMTGTSEFINQRLKTSVENLGIAIGDQLRPGLDDVKILSAEFLTNLTEFVQENSWVVSALAAAAAGVGALAAAYGALSIAKQAKKWIDALNASISSNPWMLAVTVVGTLVGLLASLGSSADDARDAVETTAEATANLMQVAEESQQAYEDTEAQLTGTKELAEQYIRRLEQLEGQSSRTEAEQEEYTQTLEKLQTILPDLNVELDEQTGLLKGGAASLREQVDGWYELAVAQALQEKYQKQIEAMAEAEAERATNLEKQKKLESDLADVRQWQADTGKAYNEGLEKRNALLEEAERLERANDPSAAQKWEAYRQSCEEVERLSSACEQLNKQEAQLEEQMRAVGFQIAVADQTIAANTEEVGLAKDAYLGYAEGMNQTKEASSGLTQEQQAAVVAMESTAASLEEAYVKAYKTAEESIYGQMGLFTDYTDALEAMNGATSDDAQAMIESLDTQLAYMDTYSANMKRAAEMGIDEGLLASLNDGSEESAKILAGLVTMSDEQVKEMNEKFKKVDEGKKNLAEGLAEYDETVLGHKDTMVKTAEEAGITMGTRLTAGLLDQLPEFEMALQRYSNKVSVYRNGLSGGSAASGRSLPAYADGTAYAAAGLALVGEEGPELVIFHGGEQVVPAQQTRRMLTDAELRAARAATAVRMPPTFFEGSSGAVPAPNGRRGRCTVEVPLYLDGREFARATAEVMGEQMFYD